MAISYQPTPSTPELTPFSLKERIVNPDFLSDEHRVTEATAAEVKELSERGFDVALVEVNDPHALNREEQNELDEIIARLESDPVKGVEEFIAPPANGEWVKHAKKALALQNLYNPESNTLGEGIELDAYDVPLFSQENGEVLSSAEVLRREAAAKGKEEKAEAEVQGYKTFLVTPIDEVSRRFYRGTLDGRAVRTRAILASDMVESHFTAREDFYHRKLTSASLACGAAEPVFKLVQRMESRGAEFENIYLLDKDVMALGGANSLAKKYDLEDKITIERRDLLADKLTDAITEKVDVVDLLGLFEYIPNDERFGPMATELLKRVKEIMKPGGVIIFGNMLKERSQQRLFQDVARWPRLQQRSVEDTLAIIHAAGFDVSTVKVRISANEGVYADYAIPIPDESPDGGEYTDNLRYAA